MTSETIAIIPARGGSKRVPQKNIREVGSKPLIAHTIADANSAERIDRAIVSTDDTEIAAVAREYGAEVPFERPAHLATDTADSAATITHALDWVSDTGKTYDVVCLLQVTNPLRTVADIDGTLERLSTTDADSVLTVSEYLSSPFWALQATSDGFLEEYFPENFLWNESPDRSQDLPKLTHPNGAVFAATVDAWERYETFYTPRTVGYEMPPERSFDIDEPWELRLVKQLMS